MSRPDDALLEDVGRAEDPGFVSDDGDGLPEEVQAELEALAASELDSGSEIEQALATAQRALEEQRERTRSAVTRYRDALLASEPDLPPDLVRGDSIEEVDAAAHTAREMVARIRERVEAGRHAGRGFPVGAPARGAGAHRSLTPSEKIAVGLHERAV